MLGIDVTPPALVSQFLVCPSWRRAPFTRTQHPSKRFSRKYLVSWGGRGREGHSAYHDTPKLCPIMRANVTDSGCKGPWKVSPSEPLIFPKNPGCVLPTPPPRIKHGQILSFLSSERLGPAQKVKIGA